jgi:hypothetical protein
MMSAYWETAVVVVVVAVAVVWALRAAKRAVTRKKVCSSCGSSGDCPLASAQDDAQGGALPLAGSCSYPPGASQGGKPRTG